MKGSFFYWLDGQVFKSIQQAFSRSKFNDIQEYLSNFSESEYKIVNYGLNLLLFIIPLSITSVMLWKNLSQKDELIILERIQSEIVKTRENKLVLSGLQRANMASIPLEDPRDFSSKLRVRFDSMDARVNISNFDFEVNTDKYQKASGSIDVSNLSNSDLKNLLNRLVQRERVIIEEVNLSRDNKNNLINGNIRIIRQSLKD